MKEKKEFNKAEIEVVRFEKTDVIATSNMIINVGSDQQVGGDDPFADDD